MKYATHSKGEKGLLFKNYFEKAYDRVSWDFLDSMLESRGFSSIFRGWITSFLVGGSFCARINDCNRPYFVAGKGLK
jgi:hypothetical protein